MRTKRCSMSIENAEAASKRVTENFLRLPVLKNCEHIAAYIANDGEIETKFLIEQLHQLGKKCYLPVLDKNQPHRLRFVQYLPGDFLAQNRYKILEPNISEKNERLPNLLDLVLVPLVACDRQGNRLGMGGGYYDRTFEFKKKSNIDRPLLVGLAYEFQCIDQLDAKIWDVPLEIIITEKITM
jgi:5-formyltetrahydrofolate cyclo-ligase